MSWGDVFFGFKGRLNRKTYWLASIAASIAALAFNALLCVMATGDLFAPAVWQRPADRIALWLPVWLAYFAFLAWPASALAIKRFHDRGRPIWIWFVYFAMSVVLTAIPARESAGSSPSFFSQIVLVMLMAFGIYIFLQLYVLRGEVGDNAHGPDPLPADYHGGDYSFWSWMLAPEGRISRAKWWLGVVIATGVCVASILGIVLAVTAVFGQHPEFAQKAQDPAWMQSAEGQAFVMRLLPVVLAPAVLLTLALWSFIALGVKRLHDRGLSSWLILVIVVPFFGLALAPSIAQSVDLGVSLYRLAGLLCLASFIWGVLQFGILKGETGPNRHGPDPLAG